MFDQEVNDCWYENYRELKELPQKKKKKAKVFKQEKVCVFFASFFGNSNVLTTFLAQRRPEKETKRTN